MGMNYYAVLNRPTTRFPIHIGKLSSGWLFVFQEQFFWHNYEEVKQWLSKHKDYLILNEHDYEYTLKEFLDMIDETQNDPERLSNPDNFKYDKNVNGYRFQEDEFI